MKEIKITEVSNGYIIIYQTDDKISLTTGVYNTYAEVMDFISNYLLGE